MTDPVATASPVGRALVVHPALRNRPNGLRSPEACLEEATGLAQAIGLNVIHAEVVLLSQKRPATLIGSGKIETLADIAKAEEAGVVIVDAIVTPVQQRNLEKALQCKVIDRTGLILEIFGARARTAEGTLQVELAHLEYQRSRLVRSWTHLERQRGGFGFLGGPGESQLEIDRRLIENRIAGIKADLANVAKRRELHRRQRKRNDIPVVALVGYTNAGKSTLFNRLTQAEVLAKDMLFATLDPTMRLLALPDGRKAILSDTVGFIADLPTHLVAAFRATLEEVIEADLILHVRDPAHQDTEAQAADVEAVLRSLDIDVAADERLLTVFNKADLLGEDALARLGGVAARGQAAVVSALDGTGIHDLLALVAQRLAGDRARIEVTVPLSDGATLAWLYRHGQVVERSDDEDKARLGVVLSVADRGRLARLLPP